MAISESSLIKLKSTLKGFDVDAIIAAAISTEQVDISVPDGNFFTPNEINTRDESIKNTNISVGKEIAIKEMKADVGLDYDGQGSKDPKRFIAEFNKKILADAKIVESDKVTERDKTIEGLRNSINTISQEKETFIKQAKDAAIDTSILSETLHLKPDHLNNNEWLGLLKNSNTVVEVDGSFFVKKNGEIVKTTTDLTPIPMKDVLSTFIAERKWGKTEDPAPPPGGRGGKDSKGNDYGTISKMSEFVSEMDKQGIHAGGVKASALLAEVQAKNPNFDMRS